MSHKSYENTYMHLKEKTIKQVSLFRFTLHGIYDLAKEAIRRLDDKIVEEDD